MVVNNFGAKGPTDERSLVCLRNRKTSLAGGGEGEGKLCELNVESWAVARSCKAERHNFSVEVTHSLVGRQTHKQILTVHYSMINALMATYTGDT